MLAYPLQGKDLFSVNSAHGAGEPFPPYYGLSSTASSGLNGKGKPLPPQILLRIVEICVAFFPSLFPIKKACSRKETRFSSVILLTQAQMHRCRADNIYPFPQSAFRGCPVRLFCRFQAPLSHRSCEP